HSTPACPTPALCRHLHLHSFPTRRSSDLISSYISTYKGKIPANGRSTYQNSHSSIAIPRHSRDRIINYRSVRLCSAARIRASIGCDLNAIATVDTGNHITRYENLVNKIPSTYAILFTSR